MLSLHLLSPELLGIAVSVVAGLFSFIPALGSTDMRRAIVAIVVLVLFVLDQQGFAFTTWQAFSHECFMVAVYSLVTYKLVLQPLVLPVASNMLIAAGLKAPMN